MEDITFKDASFAATTVDIKPTSDAGREWFSKHFGACAASATLAKSGAYEAMEQLASDGLSYSVVGDRQDGWAS